MNSNSEMTQTKLLEKENETTQRMGSTEASIEIKKSGIYEVGSKIQIEIDHKKFRNLPPGQFIYSPTFRVACCNWTIHYYPQGRNPANQGIKSSIFLVLLSNMTIYVEFVFNLIGKNGINFPNSTIPCNFSNNKRISGFNDFVRKHELDTVYCINDLIHISCNMRIIGFPKEVQVLYSAGRLWKHIENLWTKQDDNFDVTFEVEEERISAHKLILAARSPVFKAELFGHMVEANLNHIRIEDMKPEVFKALLYFIYTDKLVDDSYIDAGTPLNEFLEDLLVAADRYSLNRLKTLCEQRLAQDLSIDTIIPTLVLADRHSCVRLREKCFEFLGENPDDYYPISASDEYLQAMQDDRLLLFEWRKHINHQTDQVQDKPPKKRRI